MAQVRSTALEVREWLIANRQSTDKRGDEKSNAPWWPMLPFSDDEDRLDIRRSIMRMLIFGKWHASAPQPNGLQRACLMTLSTTSLMMRQVSRAWAFMRSWLDIRYKLSADPNKAVSLKDLRDRFGLSEGTHPTKKREFVVQMTTIGLWKVRIENESSCSLPNTRRC
jgi:hypothetical protein